MSLSLVGIVASYALAGPPTKNAVPAFQHIVASAWPDKRPLELQFREPEFQAIAVSCSASGEQRLWGCVNNHVLVFDLDGRRLFSAVSGLVREPSAIAYDTNQEVLVVSQNRVVVSDVQGHHIRTIAHKRTTAWNLVGVAVNGKGLVAVAGAYHELRSIFERNGNLVTSWMRVGSRSPSRNAIAFNNAGELLVARGDDRCVQVIDVGRGPAPIRTFIVSCTPNAMLVDKRDNIWLLDQKQQIICVHAAAGELITQFCLRDIDITCATRKKTSVTARCFCLDRDERLLVGGAVVEAFAFSL